MCYLCQHDRTNDSSAHQFTATHAHTHTHTLTLSEKVDDSNWGSQLVDVVKGDPDYKAGNAKMLVFTKDTSTADAVSELLLSSEIQ